MKLKEDNMANNTELVKNDTPTSEVSINNRVEIIEECIRKKYLSRLTEMEIVPVNGLPSLENDLIENIRLYRIEEMVYQKGESTIDKFSTVFNTLSTYNSTVFMVIDSDGNRTQFYVGVRNNEIDTRNKKSTVTLGDTLKSTLIGHFPGIKIETIDREKTAELSAKIQSQNNIASVSVVGNNKTESIHSEENFVQGIEKMVWALSGRKYTGILIAQNQSPQSIQVMRRNYEELYTKLSPYQNSQISINDSTSSSRSKSFAEMNGKQKASVICGAVGAVAIAVAGAFLAPEIVAGVGAAGVINNMAPMLGMQIGGQVGGQMNSFMNLLVPIETIGTSSSKTETVSVENKQVINILKLIDNQLERLEQFDSYGMWNIAGYFVSDDMSTSEIAASNYRSLMNGEKSGQQVSAINSWRRHDDKVLGNYDDLTTYISRFIHPLFYYGRNSDYAIMTSASTEVSGKELSLHMGLPRYSVSGLPVIEHAEFGKEVYRYQLLSKDDQINPMDRLTLGRVFDLGQITNKQVELNNKTLNMHTFITGSTGSGKSNAVYQMLVELHQDNIPFLVIEPAKGEYKDVFGNWEDVNVYSTNPNVAELININPFKFPESIHVLEHVDGLVEIFGVCWPMYDAMPAFFKDAILKSYESVGWDLGTSTFYGEKKEYPDFDLLAEQLELLINSSSYASDIKSNYKGALITRVKSLTVGLNKYIFTEKQTPYERLFEENCILDISRVKSTETKALIMGIMVYILNEYRIDKKTQNNLACNHITVLEEAHNLLKNTTNSNESELMNKSVQMLANAIAEMRAYGEGFIIVDQSPSSVDISAIKNTNTKIVLRIPEANDREAIGRSMGLTEDQVNEIAKLPKGVAVVYQNDWVKPVLTMVDKADVVDQQYKYNCNLSYKTIRLAKSEIVSMLLQPWLNSKKYSRKNLMTSLESLNVTRLVKRDLTKLIDDYLMLGGKLIWSSNQLAYLQDLVITVLEIDKHELKTITSVDELREIINSKVIGFNDNSISIITKVLMMKGDKV